MKEDKMKDAVLITQIIFAVTFFMAAVNVLIQTNE
jgi:hypothetical protein